jgi:hypothetical protein
MPIFSMIRVSKTLKLIARQNATRRCIAMGAPTVKQQVY